MNDEKEPDSPGSPNADTVMGGPDPWTPAKPNWDKWGTVKELKLWEAIALALGVDPKNFYFFGERKLDTIFNSSQPPRFAKLLDLALGNISARGVLKPPALDLDAPHESEIKVSSFVKWAKSIGLELPPSFPGASARSSVAKIKKPTGENDRSTLLDLIATLAEEARLDIARPSKAASIIEDLTNRLGAHVSARAIENHIKRVGTVVATPLQSRERTTLLTLIAALATELSLPLAKPATAASLIKKFAQDHGSDIEADVIEKHLKSIPEALGKRS